jgi:hypothetical protein
MLKIGYIGNFTQAHCTENHVKRALISLGHKMTLIQEDLYDADHVYRVGKDCDLILYTRTWGMANLQPVLDKLKAEGVPSASYHLDLYYGLARGGLYAQLASKGITGIENDPFWHTTYVFTVDGNSKSAEWFKANGINHFYMKAGVVADECYIATVPGFTYDIIFVGSYLGYHSEWPYREKLINWLKEVYGHRFTKIPIEGQPAVRNEALNELYANTKIVIGDSLCPGFNHANYWSDRVYETLGRGGFLIHPFIEGMQHEFEDRKHLAFYRFDDFVQLKALIDKYLEDDDEREQIRKTGHEFVKANCTYDKRMAAILNKIGEFEPQIKAKL